MKKLKKEKIETIDANHRLRMRCGGRKAETKQLGPRYLCKDNGEDGVILNGKAKKYVSLLHECYYRQTCYP